MSKPIMISVRGLKKSFGDQTVLRDINLEIAKGEVVALIGPSGSGKSTLLRCLNLLAAPNHGVIKIGGECFDFDQTVPEKLSDRTMARFRRGHRNARSQPGRWCWRGTGRSHRPRSRDRSRRSRR